MPIASKVVVPFHAVLPRGVPRKVSRVVSGRRLGALGAGVSNPIGAGSGAGAVEGASTGASVGSAILPGIGTAVGAIVGAAAGAIAGAFGKSDPENADFDQAVAIWQANPNNVYAIRNPYLALAGLFDLNITTNIPIYKKFGHMGEAAFTVWLCNTVYQAAQAGKIGPNDTALTIMANVVQPAINAWGYGAMSDPHADLITRLIVTMILQYTEGLESQWDAVGGCYPAQFNAIPPFSLPSAPAPPAGAAPVPTNTQVATSSGTSLVSGSNASINTPYGVLSVDSTGTWRLGPTTVGAPGQISAAAVVGGQLIANYYNGGQIVWSASTGWWVPYSAAGSLTAAAQALPTTTAAPSGVPQAPATPATVLSADGSQVTAPGTALESSAGALLYFGAQAVGDPDNPQGLPIWYLTSGAAPIHNGYAVGMLMLNGGKVYCITAQSEWYQLVNGVWQAQAAAPTATTPATTSTVASPQATQACTPATTSGGCVATPPVTNVTTGAVVGTTTTGDPVTDSDIQSLIDQMTTQNATAQQTYDAVIQSLESSGASITTGLSNQVAAQVQASVPAAPAASSNMGLYIVGGGIALLGVLYFMGRRSR